MDPWILLAAAAIVPGLWLVHPLLATAASLVVLTTAWRNRQRLWVMLALLCFAVGALRATRIVRAHESRRIALLVHGQGLRLCHGEGRVIASPVQLGTSFRIVVQSQGYECDGIIEAPATLLLYAPREEAATASVASDDTVQFTAKLGVLERFANEPSSAPQISEAARGIDASGGADFVAVIHNAHSLSAMIDHARAYVRGRINATFPGDLAPFGRALMLGENDLLQGDALAFHQSGLSHLLAVSGMHLVLVVGTFVRALRQLLLRISWLARRTDVIRVASAIGIPFAWIYAVFAGASGSSLRAAWMMSCMYCAASLGSRGSSSRALAVSCFAMGLVSPLAAWDLSFLLSVGATGGLMALSSPIDTALEPVFWKRFATLRKSIAASVAATLPCLPILASMGARYSFASLFLNLLAVPLGECVALPVCMVHACAAKVPMFERLLAELASGALALVRLLAHAGSSLPAWQLPAPTPAQWTVLALTPFLLPQAPRPRRALSGAVLLLGLLEAWQVHHEQPKGHLRVTFLDVGQGDSALVDLPNGEAILIDGGGFVGSPVDPGVRAVLPLLRARRRTHLRAVVLSHPHPDHAGGLAAVVRGLAVDQAWDTGQGQREHAQGAYANFVRALGERHVPRIEAGFACGLHEIGGASIEVLAPCPLLAGRGANDGSFVIRIRYGKRAVLLVGDAEHILEDELLQTRREWLRADVLKVGHHGSRTSSSAAFLGAVHPALAVVSSGVRNRFGHPHPTTLARYTEMAIPLWRTDREGAMVVDTDGESLDVAPLAARGWLSP